MLNHIITGKLKLREKKNWSRVSGKAGKVFLDSLSVVAIAQCLLLD